MLVPALDTYKIYFLSTQCFVQHLIILSSAHTRIMRSHYHCHCLVNIGRSHLINCTMDTRLPVAHPYKCFKGLVLAVGETFVQFIFQRPCLLAGSLQKRRFASNHLIASANFFSQPRSSREAST